MREARLNCFLECLDCGRKLEDVTALEAHATMCPAATVLITESGVKRLAKRDGVGWAVEQR